MSTGKLAGKPLLLDLFSGAGGATAGYQQLGFRVVGVDLSPQPHYVGDDFIQADAVGYLRMLSTRKVRVFTAIHASPPCQRYCKLTATRGLRSLHPDYIAQVRKLLSTIPRPSVIENVPGSPLRNPVRLCGTSFGLNLRRHRLFESNFTIPQPPCNHQLYPNFHGVYGSTGGSSTRDNKTFHTLSDWQAAMGIDWMTVSELTNAIPPAYTAYIATHLLAFLRR